MIADLILIILSALTVWIVWRIFGDIKRNRFGNRY